MKRAELVELAKSCVEIAYEAQQAKGSETVSSTSQWDGVAMMATMLLEKALTFDNVRQAVLEK